MIKPEENITKIELVYIPDYRIIATEEFHKIEMLDTIAEDQWDIFLDEFDDLKSSKKGFPPIDYIDGYAIKITYDEDDFMLISSRSGYYFYSNYKNQYIQYSLDTDEFDTFFRSGRTKMDRGQNYILMKNSPEVTNSEKGHRVIGGLFA